MEKCKGFLSVSERKAGWQISRCRTKIWHNRCKILHWKSYAVDPRLNCWICFQAFARTIGFDHSRIQKRKKNNTSRRISWSVWTYHEGNQWIFPVVREGAFQVCSTDAKSIAWIRPLPRTQGVWLPSKRKIEKLWCWILQVCRLNYIMLIVKLRVVGFE